MTAGASAIAPAAVPLASPSTPVLRVAAAWGTTIVGVKMLQRGQACVLGGEPGALAPTSTGTAPAVAPTATWDAGSVVESKTLDGGTHVFKFSELDIEGRLKSPQLVYFLRRVRAEFAAGELGHRTFMREMSETRKEGSFQ